MKVSDELRQWVDFGKDDCDELRELADRIDRETVELPKDANGEVIHIGDTVYTTDGRVANVSEIYIMQHTVRVWCIFSDGWSTVFPPTRNHPHPPRQLGAHRGRY